MTIIHVGIPPPEWESWESHLVHFHHFESMSTARDKLVKSPLFRCFNHDWRVLMYPGGTALSSEGKMAFYLAHCSGPQISAKFMFLTRDASGKVPFSMPSSEYFTFAEGNGQCWGLKDFVKRDRITDPTKKVLINGTLTVEVRIKPDDDYCCLNFIPKNPFASKMLQSFMDEDSADVIFEVSDRRGTEPGRSSKSVRFPAHKLVLQFCAEGSALASLCENCETSEPVPLFDVDPLVFSTMLYYVYGGDIAATEWKVRAKDLIDAADRYGLKNLKIEAEAWHVKHHTMTVENVIETLHYADEKNCFLLKEEAMQFILTNAAEVLASDSFEDMPESRSIVREVISVATAWMRAGGGKELEDPRKFSINELRATLYDRGKDIDGPRNRLIAELEAEPETPS